MKSVLDDDDEIGVSLVGPTRKDNLDSVVNDNGLFVSALCGRVELDLWFLSGRVFNQDWTFWSTNGCSNCDNWIGTSAFLSARDGTKTFSADSDHKVMSMTFDVTCGGVQIDELALIRGLIEEPAREMKTDLILKFAEDPSFDAFLAGDSEFVRASARLAEVVHEGATRREGLIAMDDWMRAVENTPLVTWKLHGKHKGPKNPPVHRPP